MKTYETAQGETWDGIAYKVYGSEKHADFLMKNNYKFLDVMVFSSGASLNVPDLPEAMEGELPPWRDGTGEEGMEGYDPYDDYNGEDEVDG